MLKITMVNKTSVTDVTNPPKDLVCILRIRLATSPQQLTIQGTGFTPQRGSQDALCCTLVRSGKNRKEAMETIWMTALFAHNCNKGEKDQWTVIFDVLDAATYLFTCHAFENGDAQVMIKIDKVENNDRLDPQPLLAFKPSFPTFTTSKIIAKGTVLNADNQVNCSLTPINCNTGVSTGKTGDQIAIWTNPPTDTAWSAEFDGSFSGCYLLQASAASEGTISASGQV